MATLNTPGAFVNRHLVAVSDSRPVEALKFPAFRAIRRIRAIMNLPVGFSWNISEVCPSDCECYWWKVILEERAAGEEIVELSLDEVISRFKKYRRRGMLNATLVGGEPMVRRASIEALTERVRGIHYVVVTSATTPLRPFRDTTLVISVDGQDAATHNSLRDSKGLFERILKNVVALRAEHGFDVPVFIHSTLNARNYRQLNDILAFWNRQAGEFVELAASIVLSGVSNPDRVQTFDKWWAKQVTKFPEGWQSRPVVRGVMISTWTAVDNARDELRRLSDEQQLSIVNELREAKARYGDFLVNSPYMIERLHPEAIKHQTPHNCSMAKLVASFRGDGSRIPICIFGPDAHCATCGCVSTQMVQGQRARDPETVRAAAFV